MELLEVERIGGFAGFGNPGAHIRSRGQIEFASLAEADRRVVESLFTARSALRPSAHPDGFAYRISRSTKAGTETIEVPEAALPTAIVACVKDELI
jgi:hypothetical protein